MARNQAEVGALWRHGVMFHDTLTGFVFSGMTPMTPLSYKPRVRGGNEKVSHKSRHCVMSRHEGQFQAANSEAARVILADPEQHGGAEALAVRWAQLVVERHQPEQLQGDLFEALEAAGPHKRCCPNERWQFHTTR